MSDQKLKFVDSWWFRVLVFIGVLTQVIAALLSILQSVGVDTKLVFQRLGSRTGTAIGQFFDFTSSIFAWASSGSPALKLLYPILVITATVVGGAFSIAKVREPIVRGQSATNLPVPRYKIRAIIAASFVGLLIGEIVGFLYLGLAR